MKKPVRSSHLALRFYKSDGWTKECLSKYLVRGELKDSESTHGDKPETAYFIIGVGSRLDMDNLYDHEVSIVHRWYSGPSEETDLDYLEEMNW